METVELIAKGRVQGVGFRYYVMQVANEHHIFGTVRNQSNGNVMIIAQGEKDNLTDFINHIQIPQHAYMRVAELERKPLNLEKTYTDFQIVY